VSPRQTRRSQTFVFQVDRLKVLIGICLCPQAQRRAGITLKESQDYRAAVAHTSERKGGSGREGQWTLCARDFPNGPRGGRFHGRFVFLLDSRLQD